MTTAFIGHGKVGAPLADHLQRAGHRVFVAARDADADSVRALLQRNPALQVATPEQAVRAAEVVFLATPFAANEAVIPPLSGVLAGKILVDCTNPVGPGLSQRWTESTRRSATPSPRAWGCSDTGGPGYSRPSSTSPWSRADNSGLQYRSGQPRTGLRTTAPPSCACRQLT